MTAASGVAARSFLPLALADIAASVGWHWFCKTAEERQRERPPIGPQPPRDLPLRDPGWHQRRLQQVPHLRTPRSRSSTERAGADARTPRPSFWRALPAVQAQGGVQGAALAIASTRDPSDRSESAAEVLAARSGGEHDLDQLIEQMGIAPKRREWGSLRQLDRRQSLGRLD